MTKKDYRVIAYGMRCCMPSRDLSTFLSISDWESRMEFWLNACETLADALESDNLRFDRTLFIAACRGE